VPEEVLAAMKTDALVFKERKDVPGMKYFAPKDRAATIMVGPEHYAKIARVLGTSAARALVPIEVGSGSAEPRETTVAATMTELDRLETLVDLSFTMAAKTSGDPKPDIGSDVVGAYVNATTFINDKILPNLKVGDWRWPLEAKISRASSNLSSESRDLVFALLTSSAISHATNSTLALRREYEASAKSEL